MGAGPGFEVALACPGCGARLAVGPEARCVACACGLTVGCGWHGREAAFGLEPRLRDEDQLRSALVLERVARHGAGLRAREERAGVARDALEPTAEDERRQRLKAYEREQAAGLRVLEAHRVALPLWRLWGRELALEGVGTGDQRGLRLTAETWAETRPAHPAGLGLRLSPPRLERARARPLVPEPGQRYVPWQPPPEPRGEPDGVSVGSARLRAETRRALLYWPCWLARVIDADRQGFALVDGLGGGVLSRPSAPDARALLAAAVDDPGLGGARTPAAQSWPAACPECRHPVALAGHERVVFCEVCRRALPVTPGGLGLRPYACARAAGGPAPAVWLPFWSFGLRVEAGSGEPLTRLEALRERFVPRGAGAARGEALLVPAFDTAGDERLAALPALLAQVHALDWQVQDGGLDPGGDARCAPAALDEDGARELAGLALLMALGPQALSRLSGVVSATPRLVLGSARLLLLGCDERDGCPALPGHSPLLPLAGLVPPPAGA